MRSQVSVELLIVMAALVAVALVLVTQMYKTSKSMEKKTSSISKQIEKKISGIVKDKNS